MCPLPSLITPEQGILYGLSDRQASVSGSLQVINLSYLLGYQNLHVWLENVNVVGEKNSQKLC